MLTLLKRYIILKQDVSYEIFMVEHGNIKFPDYTEGASEEERSARLAAFVPLDYTLEVLKAGGEITERRLDWATEGIRREELSAILCELAEVEPENWEFDRKEDGSQVFIGVGTDSRYFIHLLTGKGSTTETRVHKQSGGSEIYPDWGLSIISSPDSITIEAVKATPPDRILPGFTGSRFYITEIPRE